MFLMKICKSGAPVGDHMEKRDKEGDDKYDRKGEEDPGIFHVARA